jgi:hypothetical protein
MTVCGIPQSRIPPIAVQKVTRVIDDMCTDILRDKGELMQDWETVKVIEILRIMEIF